MDSNEWTESRATSIKSKKAEKAKNKVLLQEAEALEAIKKQLIDAAEAALAEELKASEIAKKQESDAVKAALAEELKASELRKAQHIKSIMTCAIDICSQIFSETKETFDKFAHDEHIKLKDEIEKLKKDTLDKIFENKVKMLEKTNESLELLSTNIEHSEIIQPIIKDFQQRTVDTITKVKREYMRDRIASTPGMMGYLY